VHCRALIGSLDCQLVEMGHCERRTAGAGRGGLRKLHEGQGSVRCRLSSQLLANASLVQFCELRQWSKSLAMPNGKRSRDHLIGAFRSAQIARAVDI